MILTGIALGLASALGGGLSNISVALAARRIAIPTILAGSQATGLVIFAVVAVLINYPVPTRLESWLLPGLLALLSTGTYYSFFVALRLGPVSVVGPIVGAYGGLVVLVAVPAFSESIRATQALGVGCASVGLLLVAVAASREHEVRRFFGPGTLFAVLALIGFSGNVIGLTSLVRISGWLPALVMWRTWMTMFGCGLVALAWWWGRRHTSPRMIREGHDLAFMFPWPTWVVAAGVLDAGATMALSVGLHLSLAWLVGLISSFGPMSTAVGGVVLFGERLQRHQVFGIALLAVSLVLLGSG